MPQYSGKYSVGSTVRIASRGVLDRFVDAWRFHHPLPANQLDFAGVRAVVAKLGFYHGGDPLYRLDGVRGLWHEACLCQT